MKAHILVTLLIIALVSTIIYMVDLQNQLDTVLEEKELIELEWSFAMEMLDYFMKKDPTIHNSIRENDDGSEFL